MGRLTHKNSKRNATFVQSWDYQYDAMNNIKSRVDNISLQGENFTYDNLNRLLDVYQGPLNQQFIGLVQSMNYDNLGNMTHKTDVGDMQYSTTHPFQMEMLTENPQTITSEHVLEYFVSGRTKTIEDNDKKLQFIYGSDLQRRKMEYFLEDQLQSTTLYPFGNYEEVHNAATNDVLKYNYIGSPDGLIAIRKTTNGTSQLYYTLTDHLGSIDALCDENGSVVERYSYDVWGNRRNPSDWTLADIRTSFITNRGFTGHEHLDKFGLINANARMYEPLTGKFLAPDPYVQAPDYSQSFNRYTYCWNNPVKYSDPSGEFIFTAATLIAAPFTGGASLALLPYAIGADLGMWQGGTLANGTMNPLNWNYGSGKTWGYMLGGAAVGVASAGIGTSVTSSAGIVTGGMAGGALSGAGFGTMGGYATGLRGQDLFNAGFTGMFIGSIAGGMGGIVGGALGGSWGAIAGGATSNLTGQLISNGFSYKDIDWTSVGISGITSLGIYHVSSYANWKGNVKKLDFNGRRIKYNQYLKIQASYTRGKFWGSERAGGGFWLTKNGISRKGVSYDPESDNVVKFDFSQKPSDAWATFHPHPYNENQVPDGNLWHSAIDIENVNSKNFSSFIINKHEAELVTPNSTYNINFWNFGKPFYIYPWIW